MRRNSADSLERFALRIEEKLRISNSSSTIEDLVCRSLTNKKNPSVAAKMAEKWVEWRYGKARETIVHEGTVTHEHFDFSKLSESELQEIERIIESAYTRADS